MNDFRRPGDDASGTPPAPQTPTPGNFVREAAGTDLEDIGRVHAAAMLASLRAAHLAAHEAPLPAGVEAMVAAPVIAAGWEQAVLSPPSPAHHVLVAIGDGGEVAGLIGLAPSPGDADTEPGPTEQGMEITALGVAPERQRRGHGSRLLAAATEQARVQGAGVLLVWAVRGDESLAGFLQQAGLRRTGSFRELPVGQGIIEDCWAAVL
ncbi:GNAT family N-acetyltransferase [Actinomyces qiguomingii]|uniref:GNAT family N-acetyltransferase n=1 Tax=Actinomyces qiguomingii TaxID=2057800 RepID=UPI000CA00965|nr:GNAT family N-acetyltransferase [Actinomyces qiguomingii]